MGISTFRRILNRLGWVDRLFILAVLVYIILLVAAPGSLWLSLVQLVAFVLAVWTLIRLLRLVARKAIWRLRNRLIVTYLFIGGVPILLIVALVSLVVVSIAGQAAVFLVTSEINRRTEALRLAADSIARTDPANRADTLRHINDLFYRERFPGIVVVLRTQAGITRYPAESRMEPPPPGWKSVAGIVEKGANRFFAWAHRPLPDGDVTILAPLSPDFLATLVPNLGTAEFGSWRKTKGSLMKINKGGNEDFELNRDPSQAPTTQVPRAEFTFDLPARSLAVMPTAKYDEPDSSYNGFMYVSSRLSAVYKALFSRQGDFFQGSVWVLLVVIAIAFLIVEIISLVVGITMTRTITRATHHLYDGTQRVMQGDFSHRIEVKGSDQLAELGTSFNVMTGRIQELLTVAKEKERLQSEIEIAREVQSQLYPKKVPELSDLKLTAVCKPARMVSGDYFDYECIRDSHVALAVGDVAGKGISAALLMATLQSSLRAELRNSSEMAVAAGSGASTRRISTATLVGHLNEQLHAYTSPEKYATFFLGMYEVHGSTLSYTNAGHLPPIHIREGQPTRLNVDGTVVGAFSWAKYEESRIVLLPGDLIVCFTDGISEPENEYGEMFGEERLVDLITKNAHRSDAQIIETIISTVEQWTGTPELQDDMTLLVARRA